MYFASNRLALLDRGFVFGIAHVRGGGDLGRMWCAALADTVPCAKYHICASFRRNSPSPKDTLYPSFPI